MNNYFSRITNILEKLEMSAAKRSKIELTYAQSGLLLAVLEGIGEFFASQCAPSQNESPDPFEVKFCRNCSFWSDPGKLATYGRCRRFNLNHHDMLTKVEVVDPSSDPAESLFTPEDFLCRYYIPGPASLNVHLTLSSDPSNEPPIS